MADLLDEARWSLFEGFAQVARLYRETTGKTPPPLPHVSEHIIPMIAERSGRDRASGGGGDGAGAQHAGHPDLEPIQYTFEPARVELAHWAHQMQVARAEMAHQPINDPDDPLLGTFDLLSHADVDAASPGARGAAIEPIRIARPVDHARDVVWDRTVEADTSIGKFEILSTDFAPPPREIVRGEPVSLETWRSWFHEGPRLPDETEEQACTRIGRLRVHPSVVREAIFRGGLENAVRPHAWRFLFGIFPWSSSVAERNQIRADRQARYMALKRAWKSQLQNLHDSASLGEHIVKDDLADNIMRIEKDVVRTDRGHPFFASSTVRQITQTDLQRPQSPTQAPLAGSSAARGAPAARTSLPNSGGASLPASPRSSTASTAPFGSQFRLTGHLEQLRDILVTYSTSPENDGLGFVQGMADLAAPILVVMKGNEADTYWCFVWMMERLKDNFRKDGSGMRRNLETMETMMRVLDPGLHVHLKVIDALNLFCCFRWFLVLFKREFEFDDVLRIWELWASDRYTTDLQHFIAMAILDEHRDAIVRHLLTFDEVLKYINDLSMNMRLDRILVRAEQLYLRFEGIARSRGCISDRDVEPFESGALGSLRIPIHTVLGRLVRPLSSSDSTNASLSPDMPVAQQDVSLSRAPASQSQHIRSGSRSSSLSQASRTRPPSAAPATPATPATPETLVERLDSLEL